MKGRFRWSHVTIALAMVAAVAIAAPAIGGQGATTAVKKQALKKLIKKQVAKQLAGKTGPQGSAGANGLNGLNGTNGANGTARAFAAVDNDGTLTDIPGGAFNITQAQVTKPGSTGTNCFAVPGVRSAIATVSEGSGGQSGGVATVEVDPLDPGGDCTVIVQTTNSAGTDADLSFFVWFQ